MFTHPGGVIGGPFPFPWVTPTPGAPLDDPGWPVSEFPFAEPPDDSAEDVVVCDETVVVVDVLAAVLVDWESVVVVVSVFELPAEGAVVLTE